MVTAGQLQGIVRTIFKNRFPLVRVASVNVDIRSDDENRRIFEIKVILQLPEKFNPADLSVVPRETIAKLTEANDPGFPIMSFIKESEWGDMKAAAG